MKLEKLKLCRIIAPGILIFFSILSIKTNSLAELSSIFNNIKDFSLSDGIYAIIFLVFGVLYYTLHIRNTLYLPYRERVDDNIRHKLLLLSPVNYKDVDKVKRHLMNIFYSVIDNEDDKSLQIKGKLVMFNGCCWTSAVDATIISFFTSIAFAVKYLITKNTYCIHVSYTLLLLSLLLWCVVLLLVNKHIKLSNDQLDLIKQNHASKVIEAISKIDIHDK